MSTSKRALSNWIPYHKELTRKEEVLLIAADTGMSIWEVTGRLMDFWAFADSNFVPNNRGQMSLKKRTLVPLLSSICPEQFLQAMVNCGWMIDAGDYYTIPNADRYLGESAKKRLKEAEKKRFQRNRPEYVPIETGHKGDICPQSMGTKTGPEKEKEKEYLKETQSRVREETSFAESPSLDEAVEQGKLRGIPEEAVRAWHSTNEFEDWERLRPGKSWSQLLDKWWSAHKPADRRKWLDHPPHGKPSSPKQPAWVQLNKESDYDQEF